MSDGERLDGGFVNEVVRHGDEVHRALGPNAAFVHALLEHLAEWPGAPRLVRTDGRTEVLTHLPGRSGAEPEVRARLAEPDALAAVVRLTRQLHDRTAGTVLAGEQEVVCHHDLDPRNTICRPDRTGALMPVAFVDWDIAGPGRRIEDVAHVAWQFVPLGPGTDIDVAADHLRLICDSYGRVDREELIPTVLRWQERCATGIEAGAAAGDSAMRDLERAGVPEQVRRARTWTDTHAVELRRRL
ncbi:phosphotransferase [Georgenia deserti]|uniref:Phosphotransferase n=1 Tax=Georgenia deserti TaxID=2093781 RepID=A0ABW4L1Q1_9MICO